MNRRPKTTSQPAAPAALARVRAADVFVALAMGLVVLAIATALNQHVGVDLNVAVLVGTLLYGAMLGMNAILRRRSSGADEAEPRDADFAPPARDAAPVRAPQVQLPPQAHGQTAPPLAKLDVNRSPSRLGEVPLPPLMPAASSRPDRANPGAVRPGSERAAAQPRLPQAPRARPFEPAPLSDVGPGRDQAYPSLSSGTLDDDVERMQALVKKLADEISANDEPEVRPPPQIYGRAPRLTADAVADSSVNVLRHAAEDMRNATKRPPAPAQQASAQPPAGPALRQPQAPHAASAAAGPPIMRPVSKPMARPAAKPQQAAADSAPPPLSPAQAHIAAVADALVAGRVDVELEPILSLVDQKTRHYEVSVQVRGAGGELLAGNEGFDGLQKTGLLPLFDCARLQRSVGIAQRLAERNKAGRVLSGYSAESLTNTSFLSDARTALGDRPGIASLIVLGFAQADVRAFTSSEWAALAELRQMQVTLSIDRLSHLDLDLRELAAAGFAFARLDAATFLSGLRFGGRNVTGADLAHYVTASGLTLVVNHIDQDQTLQRVAAIGAQLGQGRVFGGRRTVKVSKADAA